MGCWGAHSDENDNAADDTIDVKIANCLYVDADECVPLEGQALADAKDAALLAPDVKYGFFGTILGFLSDGYRLSESALDEAEEALRAEEVADASWYDAGVSRRAAIVEELDLIKAARANGGQVPPEALEGCESKGLFETILERTVQEEAGGSDAASEHSVIKGPHGEEEAAGGLPPPFAWLDGAPIKTLVRVCKAVGVSLAAGGEKSEMVAAIKVHPDRWKARNEAPYGTCPPPPTRMQKLGAVPAGHTASGVPIHKRTLSTGDVMTYYGEAGHEAVGKAVSADGNVVVNYEGGAGEEHKTRTVLTKKDITVYYKGLRGAEYKWKECQRKHTFLFEGTQPGKECKVSEHNGAALTTFEGECGAEHMVAIKRGDGTVYEYEGVKDEERMVTKTGKDGTVTRYTGNKGAETPIEEPPPPPKKTAKKKRAPAAATAKKAPPKKAKAATEAPVAAEA